MIGLRDIAAQRFTLLRTPTQQAGSAVKRRRMHERLRDLRQQRQGK